MNEPLDRDFDLPAGRSRTATALFALGLATVAANSALYFFGVEFAHPALSVLGLALLVPAYLQSN